MLSYHAQSAGFFEFNHKLPIRTTCEKDTSDYMYLKRSFICSKKDVPKEYDCKGGYVLKEEFT